MPTKRQRMAVSAAGMIVEVVLAAAALIGWWYTEPGMLSTWLLGVAIISSVGTLAVNANPLLRYDGYYLLADGLEIPNMAGRAHGLLFEKLRRWLVAEPRGDDQLLTRTQLRHLANYAVAARVYSIVIIIAIYAMLLALARPVHLQNLIYTLAVFTIAGLVLPPLLNVWRLLRNPSYRARIKRSRAAVVGAVLVMAVSAILFWPVAHTVEGAAVLVPADAFTIYATEAGELIHAVAAGTHVSAGDVIAELRDPAIELAIAKQAGDLAVREAHFQQLNTLRALESRLSRQLPTAQADLADAQAQLAQYQQRANELIMLAPTDGVVIAPPAHEPEIQAGRLATWSGSPLEPRNRHAWIEKGTVIGAVGDPNKLAALVTVDERDIAEVQPGESVKILMDSAPVRILYGTVKQVASRATEPAPDESSATRPRRHIIEVELDSTSAQALIGTGGTAKIEASRTTLFNLTTDFVKRRLKMPW